MKESFYFLVSQANPGSLLNSSEEAFESTIEMMSWSSGPSISFIIDLYPNSKVNAARADPIKGPST